MRNIYLCLFFAPVFLYSFLLQADNEIHSDQNNPIVPSTSLNKLGYFANPKKDYVDILATYKPIQFNHGFGLHEHHFIVWEKGKAHKNALFTTLVSDSLFHELIVSIGGKPGNNLTQETWTKRKDKKSKEPDKTVAGSKLTITIFQEKQVFTLPMILRDLNNKDYSFRFGGNLELIPFWRSGCIVCLQSCPGGKIGNETYTIRDLHNQIPAFKVNKTGHTLKPGDQAIVRFTIKE